MSEILLLIFVSGISCLALWWFAHSQFRGLSIDVTRQRLFEIRDELFDLGLSGLIPFDSKAYAVTRSMINGMIRFAYELSFLRLVVMAVMSDPKDELVEREMFDNLFDRSLGELKPEQSAALKKIHFKAHVAITAHLFRTSVILSYFSIALMTLRLLGRFAEVVAIVLRKNTKILSRVDGEALKLSSAGIA